MKRHPYLPDNVYYLVLFIAVAMVFSPSVFGFGLAVEPMRLELNVEPGTQFRELIKVYNISRTKTTRVNIGVADWDMDDNGKLSISPSGSTSVSASKWVRFSPGTLVLKPVEANHVVVDVTIPAKLEKSGDYLTCITVETVLPPQKERNQLQDGVWSSFRLLSLFYLTVDPAEAKINVMKIDVNNDEEQLPTVQLRLINEGSRHDRIKGLMPIYDQNRNKVLTLPISEIVVLAGKTRTFNYELPKSKWEALPAGNYTFGMSLKESGGNEITMPSLSDLVLTKPDADKIAEKTKP